ncbi:MAG: trypsin-like serine protease [Deltaproteobacteria bacterium]|jgi:V8-like Glu-specific endopeptidase|nr:trypsin-like serine protease [Deltaproteobacteria bacterium]MDL1986581.1 trypsin-like serine protease [Deltaproteobacteria bacterium]
MSIKLGVIAIPMILLLVIIAPAAAITNGGPDGEDHPHVGLAVFYDADGNPMWRCSGTLLSETLFLTAGHCTEEPAASAAIWFEEDVDAGIPGNGYPFGGGTSVVGTPYTHPDYNPTAFYLYDLGVVVLDEPVVMDEYGALPEEGLLDPLAKKRGRQDVSITAVGYGLQKINPVFVVGNRERLQATLMLVDLIGTAGVPAGTSVMLSANVHTGGTCFGDSGGPLFLNDTNIVAAVTSFGLNGNCRGVGAGYRVDTADDLDWLYDEFGDHLP